MSDPGQLLRMLEPAVRPVSLPTTGSPPKPANTPFESQSFDQLLQQATNPSTADKPAATASPDPATTADPPQPVPVSTFQPLSGIDRIENQSLRNLIAQPAADPPKPAR
ncbi:MAG: hypothetical protein AAGI68_04430 [Planctomycetota bacterium]